MSKRTRIARKEIKKMEAELHSDYAQFMQQMKDYLRFADVGADQKTLIYHDIVNMLLEGQARGPSVQEVIGDDYRVFCDEVIASAPRLSPVMKWMALAQQFLAQLFVFLAVWIVLDLFNNLAAWPDIPFTAGRIWLYLGFIVLAWYISWNNAKYAFSDMPRRVIGLYVVLFCCLIAGDLIINSFFGQPMIVVNMVLFIGVAVLVGLAWLVIDCIVDKSLA